MIIDNRDGANGQENDSNFDTFLHATFDFDDYSTFLHDASILFNEKGKKGNNEKNEN